MEACVFEICTILSMTGKETWNLDSRSLVPELCSFLSLLYQAQNSAGKLNVNPGTERVTTCFVCTLVPG